MLRTLCYLKLLFLSALVAVTQSRSLDMKTKKDDNSLRLERDLWTPNDGSREEWLRCHGQPCDQWERVKQKINDIKLASLPSDIGFDEVGEALKMKSTVADDAGDLDGCIWLTEDQCDEITHNMKLESEIKDGKHRQKRNLVDFKKKAFRKWPLPIRWKFDGNHNNDEQKVIRNAFQHWTDNTCVRFEELGKDEKYTDNHILITNDANGCYSYIGRVTVIPQQLNLAARCLQEFGTPVHEIGHALGLWHEQQRWDRDDNIRIIWDNIGSYVGQFYKHRTQDLVPYDAGSVMHYAPKDGSKNGKNVMETFNPHHQHSMGQRTGLSFLDAKIINLAYCTDVCRAVRLSKPCQRDGYQDPNDCSRCKCPDGFGGRFCEEVAQPINGKCGGEIHVTKTGKIIESPGYTNPRSYDNHDQCSWLIKAPAGHKVELRFEDEFGVYWHFQEQCFHWVEVRYTNNLGMDGARFCGYERPDIALRSDTDEMMVVFKANFSVQWASARRGFRARVVAVPNVNGGNKPTTTTPKTEKTEQAVWECNFEGSDGEGSFCGMTQYKYDHFDWTLMSGGTPSKETGPEAAYRGKYYMYIEASKPRLPGDTAIMLLPKTESSGRHCLSFYYNMYGFHINAFALAKKNQHDRMSILWYKAKQQGKLWHEANIEVDVDSSEQLALVGIRGNEFSGDIALDELKLYKGNCPEPTAEESIPDPIRLDHFSQFLDSSIHRVEENIESGQDIGERHDLTEDVKNNARQTNCSFGFLLVSFIILIGLL